jgi:homoserine dehydrogenase
MATASPLRVALLGMGTVGTGVARILTDHAERIARRAGRSIELRRAVVANVSKSRGVSLPSELITDNLEAVYADKELDIVLHLVGGLEPARTIMLRLLESGKDVVTANKALLCEHGDELFRRARELGRTVAFEAAVAGGIPIIAAIGQSMAANQITSIQAILNGTSNFILTEMHEKGRSYADVLAEAQRLGYAEADPTLDVDGTDAAQKLVLLSQLAFGTKVPVTAFHRQGIDRLELADLKYATELGYRIKLLATARLVEGKLEMHVQPTFVRADRPLAKTSGAYNMIELTGDAVGRLWYSGAGAGEMPTASAVVADLIDLAVGRAQLTFTRLDIWREHSPLPLLPTTDMRRRFYLRYNVEDRPHVLADIADSLGRRNISIASVIQKEAESAATPGGQPTVPLVIMTHECTEGAMRNADAELDRLKSIRIPRVRIPVA